MKHLSLISILALCLFLVSACGSKVSNIVYMPSGSDELVLVSFDLSDKPTTVFVSFDDKRFFLCENLIANHWDCPLTNVSVTSTMSLKIREEYK